jgi:hypothetical protein
MQPPHVIAASGRGASDRQSDEARNTGDTDRSVIDRPFPVSASVVAGCRLVACPELDEALAKFSAEPRDSMWAPGVEQELRDFVDAQSGKYTIRNIECRSTMCMVEVASISGSFLEGISMSPQLDKLLLSGVGGFGYERDPSSARVTVTTIPYNRR